MHSLVMHLGEKPLGLHLGRAYILPSCALGKEDLRVPYQLSVIQKNSPLRYAPRREAPWTTHTLSFHTPYQATRFLTQTVFRFTLTSARDIWNAFVSKLFGQNGARREGRGRSAERMGWLSDSLDSIRTLQIRHVLTQIVSLGSSLFFI
ncbi:hypothetical protein B296_00026833 [Ensete ventricosum]|uniref:Uncharacterized protein n=1 Tax=Ensete ventricosum TaxID=4639 RepID=A0A427AQS6_ENSVE|nr:hypothetical protein B296_00026833 [Ensete ventricosum]